MSITLEEYRKWVETNMPDGEEAGTDDQAKLVNEKLVEVLGGRDVEYTAADWKDVTGLLEDVLNSKFNFHTSDYKIFEPFYEVEGGGGGSDDYVLIAISPKATQEELEVVYDLMHNFGAELPEPHLPTCPACGKGTIENIDIQVVDQTDEQDYQCFVATARTEGKLLGTLQYKNGYGDTSAEAFNNLLTECKIKQKGV